MPPAPQSKILLAGDPIPVGVQGAMESGGCGITLTGLIGVDPAGVSLFHAVLLCVTVDQIARAQALCRRWRIELGEQFVPIVWRAPPEMPGQAGLDCGADVVLPTTVSNEHLVSQFKALLRVQQQHNRLASRAAEAQNLNQRLQNAHHQLDADLELTRRIHRGFMPRSIPDVGNLRFAVCYRPRSRIGGDFFDVIRLDEDTVGLFTADATSRGVSASSLLSIFVRKCLVPKEILGHEYRLVPPNEILNRLNRDLVNLGLPEPPFVTMLYFQMNCKDGSMTFARAAHPHPLQIPRVGDPIYWNAAGTLLGVFEAEFPLHQRQLSSGDKLLIYSDGVHPPNTGPGGMNDPLAEAAKKHRSLAIQPFVDAVARDLLEESRQPEDFTILGVEYV